MGSELGNGLGVSNLGRLELVVSDVRIKNISGLGGSRGCENGDLGTHFFIFDFATPRTPIKLVAADIPDALQAVSNLLFQFSNVVQAQWVWSGCSDDSIVTGLGKVEVVFELGDV